MQAGQAGPVLSGAKTMRASQHYEQLYCAAGLVMAVLVLDSGKLRL